MCKILGKSFTRDEAGFWEGQGVYTTSFKMSIMPFINDKLRC